MSETRRATVMLIQRGDPEISGALMAGVIAGRAEAAERGTTSSVTADTVPPVHGPAGPVSLKSVHRTDSRALDAPEGEGFWEDDARPVESVEIVTVEADEQQRVARLVRIAVGNTRTAEDYRHLIVKARGDYADHSRPGPLHTVAGKLLLAWALIWQGIWRAYDAQEKVLRP